MLIEPLPESTHLITIAEAASRIGRSKGTVQNWIYSGRLRGAQGLCYVNNRPAIDWPLFQAAFVKRAA